MKGRWYCMKSVEHIDPSRARLGVYLGKMHEGRPSEGGGAAASSGGAGVSLYQNRKDVTALTAEAFQLLADRCSENADARTALIQRVNRVYAEGGDESRPSAEASGGGAAAGAEPNVSAKDKLLAAHRLLRLLVLAQISEGKGGSPKTWRQPSESSRDKVPAWRALKALATSNHLPDHDKESTVRTALLALHAQVRVFVASQVGQDEFSSIVEQPPEAGAEGEKDNDKKAYKTQSFADDDRLVAFQRVIPHVRDFLKASAEEAAVQAAASTRIQKAVRARQARTSAAKLRIAREEKRWNVLPVGGPALKGVFIHGTTSHIFGDFPDSNFTLDSTHRLLTRGLPAPLTGEITLEGLMGRSTICEPRFGLLAAHDKDKFKYNLRAVHFFYARDRTPKAAEASSGQTDGYDPVQEKLLQGLRSSIETAYKTDFRNINVLLVELSRAKRLGIDLAKQGVDTAQIKKQFHASIELFYLTRLLGRFIVFKKKELPPSLDKETLIQSIIDKPHDLAKLEADLDAYDSKAREGLDSLRARLAAVKKEYLGEQAVFDAGLSDKVMGDAHQVVEVPERTEREERISRGRFAYLYGIDGINIAQHTGLNCSDSLYWKYISKGDAPDEETYLLYMKELNNVLSEEIEALEERGPILEGLLDPDVHYKDQGALDDSLGFSRGEGAFPIILVHDNPEKEMMLINEVAQEYLSENPVFLGKDITLIATDTAEHAEKLEVYLAHHKASLHGKVDVCLIDDLYYAQYSGQRPKRLPPKAMQTAYLSAESSTPGRGPPV